MAKLIYSAIASADGYVEDASGGFGWAAPDEAVHRFVNDLERPVGTYLYGRRMYETMAGWETAHTVPGQKARSAAILPTTSAQRWRPTRTPPRSSTRWRSSTARPTSAGSMGRRDGQTCVRPASLRWWTCSRPGSNNGHDRRNGPRLRRAGRNRFVLAVTFPERPGA